MISCSGNFFQQKSTVCVLSIFAQKAECGPFSILPFHVHVLSIWHGTEESKEDEIEGAFKERQRSGEKTILHTQTYCHTAHGCSAWHRLMYNQCID